MTGHGLRPLVGVRAAGLRPGPTGRRQAAGVRGSAPAGWREAGAGRGPESPGGSGDRCGGGRQHSLELLKILLSRASQRQPT